MKNNFVKIEKYKGELTPFITVSGTKNKFFSFGKTVLKMLCESGLDIYLDESAKEIAITKGTTFKMRNWGNSHTVGVPKSLRFLKSKRYYCKIEEDLIIFSYSEKEKTE